MSYGIINLPLFAVSGRFLAMQSSRSSRPCLFLAEIRTVESSQLIFALSGSLSALLRTFICGIPSQPSSFRSSAVTCDCSYPSSALISIRLMIISAFAASSRVLLKASTRLWGSLRTSPTVSIRRTHGR